MEQADWDTFDMHIGRLLKTFDGVIAQNWPGAKLSSTRTTSTAPVPMFVYRAFTLPGLEDERLIVSVSIMWKKGRLSVLAEVGLEEAGRTLFDSTRYELERPNPKLVKALSTRAVNELRRHLQQVADATPWLSAAFA